MAFHKNSYVGRTFIKPKQSQRESSVKIKLNVIEEVVRGKRIVMVDDSIVRGTTCANIIKMLKKAGAKEVHVRISSPPFLHPCYFGTDVPSNDQLIAHSHTTEPVSYTHLTGKYGWNFPPDPVHVHTRNKLVREPAFFVVSVSGSGERSAR